jgi:ADP-ribose pyrophosphatase YjhB (NUDIX family)
MKVQQHSVKMADEQSLIHDWLWIDYHDRINVLVEDEAQQPGQERRFLVFQQTKYALEGRISMAVVGGIVEPHEDAQVAARREVEEEMGMHCDHFHFLGRFRTDVNRGMGWVNSFLASHCSRSKEKSHTIGLANADKGEEVGAADTERQDLKSITLQELREAATSGQFLEVQWSNTVSLALLHPELMA